MDNPFQSPVILSLCSGMRGLERGIERAIGRVRIAAYVEIEAFLIYNLVKQMEQGLVAPVPVWTDLKTFPAKSFHRKVHGLIGGYPCQPFSVSGKRLGEKDPRHLWPHIKRIAKEIQPAWCFFENVPGHLNLGFRKVKSELEEMGYRTQAGIYSAQEVGAPHLRERLFILALLANTDSKRGKHGDAAEPEGKIQVSKITPHRSGREQFPSRRGEPQKDWERFHFESRLGCSVNGYNFREDLLRMYGNGVVEQTAELAFKDLLNKHLRA